MSSNICRPPKREETESRFCLLSLLARRCHLIAISGGGDGLKCRHSPHAHMKGTEQIQRGHQKAHVCTTYTAYSEIWLSLDLRLNFFVVCTNSCPLSVLSKNSSCPKVRAGGQGLWRKWPSFWRKNMELAASRVREKRGDHHQPDHDGTIIEGKRFLVCVFRRTI